MPRNRPRKIPNPIRFTASPAKRSGTAGEAPPDDIVEALGIKTNHELHAKIDAIRVSAGKRPLAQGDVPTNRGNARRLHHMARDIISELGDSRA